MIETNKGTKDGKGLEAPQPNPADVSQRLLQEAEQSRVAVIRSELQALSVHARDALLLEYKSFAIEAKKHPNIIKKVEKGELLAVL